MKYLAFVTEGSIDLRSFTTFGFNAKPNSVSPIGFFGTGLKIATAVLARLGCNMSVLVNGVEYEFYVKDTDFRGKIFEQVLMKKRKGSLFPWRYQSMPYTTELGKNWESWQVFRELESNTRDENGTTFLLDDETPAGMSFLSDRHLGRTVIFVDEPSVVRCYEEIDTIFLPKNLKLRSLNDRCEAYNVGSTYLYYRGMRVLKLDRPSAFTYNITAEQRLTEDRTLYHWSAAWEIRRLIMENHDQDFIDSVLSLEAEKFWEGSIEFDDYTATSSQVFRDIVSRLKITGKRILPRAVTFFDRYNIRESPDPDVTVTLRRSQWETISTILSTVELPDLTRKLDWDAGDRRFDALKELMSIITEKKEKKYDADEIPF